MLSYNLEVIESREQFLTLEREWRALLECCPHSFFQTWEYTSLWLAHYGSEVRLRTIVLRDSAGVACGIAPFIVIRGQSAVREYWEHLTLLGGLCESLAEYLDVLVAPGHEAAFLDELATLITREKLFLADSLYLELQEPGSTLMLLAERLQPAFGQLQARGTYSGTAASLPTGWASYYATRSGKLRSQLKNALIKLQAQHHVVFRWAGEDVSVDEAMDSLIQLNANRWGKQNIYHSAKFCDFHRELAHVSAANSWLAMPMIQADGQIVSIRYDFAYAGKIYAFQGGWNLEWKNFNLGQLLIKYVLEHGLAKFNCHEFDFMAGGLAYQEVWKSIDRSFNSAEIMNPKTLKGWSLQTLRGLKQRANEVLKRATSYTRALAAGSFSNWALAVSQESFLLG